jgi:hypothetical protein
MDNSEGHDLDVLFKTGNFRAAEVSGPSVLRVHDGKCLALRLGMVRERLEYTGSRLPLCSGSIPLAGGRAWA